MKAAIIFNPVAGHWKAGAIEKRIQSQLRKNGIDSDILETAFHGDGINLARNVSESEYNLIIAAGGDGTINEVVNGMIGKKIPLGIIPIGSVNVLARDMGIPFYLNYAIQCIAKMNTKKIDIGLAGNRYFTLMAGFGFDAEVVSKVDQPIKDVIGASAYIIKGLEKLTTYNATNITLDMNNLSYSSSAFLIIVANVSTYTYGLKITPYAEPDDGLLDICVFERPILDKLGFANQIRDVFVNRHLKHDEVKYFRAQSVKVNSEPEIAVQLDGEPFCNTPVEIKIIPSAINLIIPD